MAVLKAKTTESNLLKKGFTRSPGDHRYFEFIIDGVLVSKTKTSHNSQDIGNDLITAMSNQCKMSKPFFKEFAKCTKSKADYIKELKEKKYIK